MFNHVAAVIQALKARRRAKHSPHAVGHGEKGGRPDPAGRESTRGPPGDG